MSIVASAAALCAPVSWARAQNTGQHVQAVERVTITPTSNSADATATPNSSVVIATATDLPTLQPSATVLVATPVAVAGTSAPRGTATATATPSSSTNATVAPPSPTAVPTLIATSSPTLVPTLPVPTPTIIPFNSDLTDVTIQAGSDPTRTVNLGEQIVFTIELKTRESLSEGLFITATIPDGTDYVFDSAVPVQPTTPASATATDTADASEGTPAVEPTKRTLSWQVQPMGTGQTFIARYAVRVNRVTASIVASASAVNMQTGATSTSNAVVLPTQPTAITLLHFDAHTHPLGIKIMWQTGQEITTAGFVLWRNTTNDRASATLITGQLIGAQGSGVGANYEYVDSGVAANQHYSYWLQEVAESGVVHDYGPLSAVAVSQSPQIVIAGSVGAGGVPLPVQVSGVDPSIAQTVQAGLQRNASSVGESTNGVRQVSAQPIASPAVQLQAPVPEATPLPPIAPTSSVPPDAATAVQIATLAPAADVNSSNAIPRAIATIDGTQHISSSVANVNPPIAPSTNTIPEKTDLNSKGEASVPAAAGAALPAAPSNSQVVVPQMNVAAPPASEESRGEGRSGLLNWLLTGLLACFGWLIVSSFLAVAVGRYLKGRQ